MDHFRDGAADALSEFVLGTKSAEDALKDFFDRTFYETEGQLAALPYAVFISAGNDGTGALREIRRIATGYRFREVQAPIIARGAPTGAELKACHELGLTMAAGLEAAIW